jgi:transglutaminase-like putative cysteine protease
MFQPFNDTEYIRPGRFQSILLLGLLFLLFVEWLRPLPVILDTINIAPFVIFCTVVLTMYLLRLSAPLQAIITLSLSILFIKWLLIEGPLFSREWIVLFFGEWTGALELLIQGEFIQHSVIVRTFLFMLLLWFMCSYLYHAAMMKKGLFSFFLSTVVFLAVIDTFTPYVSNWGIVRTLCWGFLLLAVKEMVGVQHYLYKQITLKQRIPYPWLAAAIGALALVVSVGVFSPKAAPSWPDPVPFIQSYSENIRAGMGSGGSSFTQRVGYGAYDDWLGGPFQMDETPVFMARTDKEHYWRGESKDVYTGKGWVSSSSEETTLYPFHSHRQQFRNLHLVYPEIETNALAIQVQMLSSSLPVIFMPASPVDLLVYPSFPYVKVDENAHKISVWQTDSERGIYNEYLVNTRYPVYDLDVLREADLAQVPEEVMAQYTQLPESLPERVGELAATLTQQDASMYDKAKRVEAFLRSAAFVYETEDVPFPQANEDYVYQFLFETQRGYCNNFSSAMVVMLRTLDIPARWVKGFAAGEDLEDDATFFSKVVRNKDAHSWVEVYFPDVGWVPFEPTPGFTNYYEFSSSGSTGFGLDFMDDYWDEYYEELYESEFGEFESAGVFNEHSTGGPGFTINRGLVLGIAIVLSLIAVLILLFRHKLFLLWAIQRYRKQHDPALFLKAYEVLLRVFGRVISPKQASETLREYALRLNQKFDAMELKELTTTFENIRYGEKDTNQQRVRNSYQLWESLMQRLRS